MGSPDSDLGATFAAQHGLITRQQVLAAGLSQRMIEARLRHGTWRITERGVYAHAAFPWTWRRHLAAVVLSCPRGFASHRSAALLLGVGDFRNPPLELTVPDGRRPKRSFEARAIDAGVDVVIHEVEDVDLEPTIVVDGIRCCTPLRLAVDIGTKVFPDRFYRIVGDLRRAHGITWTQLEDLWRSHSRRGRDGCGPLRELLDAHFAAEGAPSEVIEARCAKLLIDAGLPEPVHQFEVTRPDGRTARLDLAYPDMLIGIETEGGVHDSAEVRQADHARRNNLQLLGWTIFHFTWTDLVHRPNYVVTVIRNAIEFRQSIPS